MTTSTDVTWVLDDITMAGTVATPDGTGPFPGVVLVAGSGPTDRDWCSPLLPGANGSGRLLAGVLADAGFASIRYDKRASGPDAAQNVPRLIGRLSMASHLQELVAAVNLLAERDDVDPARIVLLGNSEGTLHVLHYAATRQQVRLRGLILLAPPGRPVREVLLSQLALQAAQVPDGQRMMSLAREAADRYSAGLPTDPDPSLPESVRLVLASFDAPANLPLARELWDASAAADLARVTVPTLVVIGGADVQVDAQADGEPLQRAAEGNPLVSFAFPPHANHVLKEDRRTPAEIAASPGIGYNGPDTHLDPQGVALIVEWLRSARPACRPV